MEAFTTIEIQYNSDIKKIAMVTEYYKLVALVI